MITRSQMRRQLRAQGGIMSVAPREKFGIGSTIKDRIRKLIPNELADVAVKAAPFVAPFYPGYAAIARGLGRFDQRGSISDALKQGAATYAFGKAARGLAGAEGPSGGLDTFSMEGFKERGAGRLFQGGEKPLTKGDPNFTGGNANTGSVPGSSGTPGVEPTGIMKRATEATIDKIPFADKLPQIVKEKLLVGGITSGASALYSYFTGAFDDPQQPGESMEEYMARRNTRVKQQMRGYMDSYYTPLRNPQYAAMSDEEKNNYIDSIVGQGMATGGRVGLANGNLVDPRMQRSLAENVQKLSTQPRAQNADLRDFFTNQATSQAARSMARTAGGYPNFLQMSPENISQARKLTYPQAFALEKQYKYNPNYAGADKTSRLGYFKQGLQSLAGIQQPGSNVGGATPLTRKLALDVGEKVLPALGKGLAAVTSLPAQATLMTLNPTTANADEANMIIEDFQNLYNSPEEQAAREADKARQAATPTPDAGAPEGGINIGGRTFYENAQGRGPGTYDTFYDGAFTAADSAYEMEKDIAKRKANQKPTMADVAGVAKTDPRAGIKEAFLNERLSGGERFGDAIPDFDSYGTYTGSDQLLKDYAAAGRGTPSSQLVRLPEGNPYAYSGPGYYEYDGSSFSKTADLNMTPEYEKMIRLNYGLASGGRVGLMGGSMPMGEPRVNQGGITELDFRAKGGFVPVGIKEKADDVPAMLSKNEFVFTADAVRGAGNGSIENGAQKMYDTMKNLERRVT